MASDHRQEGLSPRLRGNLGGQDGKPQRRRSIPAPAGEPSPASTARLSTGVYPRACGGTFGGDRASVHDGGLSPRLRGNPGYRLATLTCSGSIPAPAGEPWFALAVRIPPPVYPRACGGTACEVLPGSVRDAGLSPRLRGNRLRVFRDRPGRRSIPAPAGEPGTNGGVGGKTAVYPRACGGTRQARLLMLRLCGLSPRLRGNHVLKNAGVQVQRSIPAPAGEPCCGSPRACGGTGRPGVRWGSGMLAAVYPRACGGTVWTSSPRCWSSGLSPRLRGNRMDDAVRGAGPRVYPRACGGTIELHGSRGWSPVYPRACGGTMTRVYPRACGGTLTLHADVSQGDGLSPRLRGNPRGWWRTPGPSGSIPAPAGEPKTPGKWSSSATVYPRACGGTRQVIHQPLQVLGLSPRLRGNRGRVPDSLSSYGSIPAPAGEPSRPAIIRSRTWVYPRACGGT